MNLEQALAALAAAHTKTGELTAQLSAANARADEAETKAKKRKDERDDMEKKLVAAESAQAAEKTRADAAEAAKVKAETERKDAADNFAKRVTERANLVAVAAGALGRNDKGDVLDVDGTSTIKLDALDDRAIRIKVVRKLDGIDIPTGRSDDAVELAYTLATDRAAKAGKALGNAREVLVAHNLDQTDAARDDGDLEAKAQRRMDARRGGAWKTLQTANTAVGAKSDDKDKE